MGHGGNPEVSHAESLYSNFCALAHSISLVTHIATCRSAARLMQQHFYVGLDLKPLNNCHCRKSQLQSSSPTRLDTRAMTDASLHRLSRRTMRTLGVLVSVSALLSFSVTVFATSEPSSLRRQPLSELGKSGTLQRTLQISRRSPGEIAPSSLDTAGDATWRDGTPTSQRVAPARETIQPSASEQVEETPDGSLDAGPLAMKPLYSSVDSLPRYPLSAAQQDAGKG